MSWPVLSLVTFLPLLGAVLIVVLARGDDWLARGTARWIALWTTLVTFAISLVLIGRFDPASPEFQFVEKHDWLGIASYHVGVDGISLPFVILTTALMPLCILASWTAIQKRVKAYMIAFLVLETLMIGTFAALDLVLFYLFFEGVLIPMFLIIGVWGGAAPGLRELQVLPLYAARLGAHAARDHGDVLGCRHDRHCGADASRLSAWLAEMGVACLLCLLRGENADVAGAHLAARRSCRSADRGLGDPCRHPAEDGWLWVPALFTADVPLGQPRLRAAHLHAVGRRHHLHLAGRADAGGH